MMVKNGYSERNTPLRSNLNIEGEYNGDRVVWADGQTSM